MDSHDLRKKIERTISSKVTNAWYEIFKKQYSELIANNLIDFFKGYIRQVPDILDLVYSSASKTDLLSIFQPVYNYIFTYWDEENDVIDDKTGIVGLTDDAYLSLCLMQRIADSHPTGTDRKLIELDLSNDNKTMKNILGKEFSTKLDKLVEEVFSSVQFQIYLNALINNPMIAFGFQGFNIQQMNGINPQYWKYQQQLRELDNVLQMKHEAFSGQLSAMAANAGISWP
jgi:hypothetical protein